MSGPSPATDVACPRCGYDLRGAVAMWREACPLTGTCTECGLDFEWAELLSETMVAPPWCVESRQPRFRLPRQIAATMIRACRPWRFWSALRMSHRIRWRRVTASLGFVVAVLYASFALTHAWLVWTDWNRYATWLGVVPRTTGSEVFWRAAALPLANPPAWSWTPRMAFVEVWMPLVFLLPAALIMHVGCGLAFAALPITRRQCKVRWAHIARVAGYGSVLLVPALALTLAALPMYSQWIAGRELVAWLARTAWLALPLTEVIWWTAATSRYLRMPHAWAVGVAVTAVGVLLGLAIVGWTGMLTHRI